METTIMRQHCILPLLAIVGTALALPGLAHADGANPGYLNSQTLSEKYDREKKIQMQEGYVLEPLNDKAGNKIGTLSFGGETRIEDPYQGIGARTNFGSRDPNEPPSAMINLRISF